MSQSNTGAAARGLKLAALLAAILALPLSVHQIAQAQTTPRPAITVANPEGEAIYKRDCAACHDEVEPGSPAPSRASLMSMRYSIMDYVLTQGKMKVQAQHLSDTERGQLINFLTARTPNTGGEWIAGMMCPQAQRNANISGPVIATGFGFDVQNTRSLTAAQAGLSKAQMPNMELAWAIAIPGVTMMRAQPTIVGKHVFLPVAEAGQMYAFDVSNPAKPCLKWVYNTPGGAPLRTNASYGVLADGRKVLATSGQDTTVYLIDAKTGAEIWKKKVGAYRFSTLTGSPTITKDRIIVPVSQFEITMAADNDEMCCNHHGYVVSLDPRTGAEQWRYHTMPEAQPLRDRGDGKMLHGPSGAPIWNSPSVDEKRGLIYFGTGEANSPPAHVNTNALIAISLKDGKEVWAMQATPNDIYNTGCGARPRPNQYNCVSDTVYRDVDFGGSSVQVKTKSGKEMVVSGQKSGSVWALEPATGKLIWRQALGTGGPNGGIHWGVAYHNDTIYAPIAAVGRNYDTDPVDVATIKSGLYALDANTGAIKWHVPSAIECPPERAERFAYCRRASNFSAVPSVIDGAVVQGSLDGWVRIFDGVDGKLLWKFDTTAPVTTLNGTPGRGGSIDASSVAAGNGLLFVNSGYSMFGQAQGNLFMAFRAKT